MRRGLLLGSIVGLAALLAGARPAWAEDDAKKSCASAFVNGQRLMRNASLLDAAKMFAFCGGPQCPSSMQAECQQWLGYAEASTPTVVFRVPSTAPQSPADVRVSIDGGEFVSLDGRAISMDPGSHDVTIVADGFATMKTRISVSEGEKLHHEAVILSPLPPPQPTAPAKASVVVAKPAKRHARLVVPMAVAASVAALAGISAIYWGVKARSDDRDLDQCTPACSRSSVDDVRREYLWTNLSIGLAVAGTATAAVLFLVGRSSDEPAQRASLGVVAGPDSLGASLTGRF